MFIDILYIILIVLAAIKGYSRGLIVAVFSFLAVVIGLAAALKLSATVAAWLNKSTSLGLKWLPFLAFLLIIIVVILLVRIAAGLLQKSVELVFAGWLNKLGGIILYACLYTMVYSVFIFYATQIHLLNTNAVAASSVYHFIEPWGPFCINLFGDLIPLFKGLFEELKTFFGKFAA
ncbi:MAG: CvpA family protein [Sphingobacteriia bacterium]|nr:CvpA family protein [Sphingobacteriia bacterium]